MRRSQPLRLCIGYAHAAPIRLLYQIEHDFFDLLSRLQQPTYRSTWLKSGLGLGFCVVAGFDCKLPAAAKSVLHGLTAAAWSKCLRLWSASRCRTLDLNRLRKKARYMYIYIYAYKYSTYIYNDVKIPIELKPVQLSWSSDSESPKRKDSGCVNLH